MNKLIFKRMHIYKLHRSELLDHKEGRPAILLKYKNQKLLIWAGTHKCDLKTKEKDLIISLNGIDTYFYSSGIERVYTNNLKDSWVDFSTYRTYVLKSEEQIELIAKFISFTYENDPYLENKKLKEKLQKLLTWNKELQKENSALKDKNLWKEKTQTN